MMSKRNLRPPALALVGIVVIVLNLRTAIPTIPPILDAISRDFPVSELALGAIGAAPSVCFAVFGFAAPWVTRRLGLERSVIVILVAVALGHVARGGATSALALLAATAVTLGAVGVGNVLLPALIKRYFPTHISALTALVGFIYSISTSAAAVLSSEMATSLGWRMSLASWGLLALAAIVPWIVLARGVSVGDVAGIEEVEAAPEALGRVRRSALAWALAAVFGYGAFAIYSLFIWLPSILRDVAGIPLASSGAMLAAFAIMGIPMNLVIVAFGNRAAWQVPLTIAGIVFFVIGFGGLLIAPEYLPLLWVVCLGLGPFMMQMVLVLLGVRTRTSAGTVALSAFVQGVGFAMGAIGPPLIGLLHRITGGWTVAILTLLGALVVPVVALVVLRRHRMLEDEWHGRRRR